MRSKQKVEDCLLGTDLCVPEDGVIEEDAEEHEAQGDDLLPCDGLDPHEFLCGGSTSCVIGSCCHHR